MNPAQLRLYAEAESFRPKKMKTVAILLLLGFAGVAVKAEMRCVALYPSPTADPHQQDVEARIHAFFQEKKIEIQAGGSATVWISVSAADYPRARAALIEAVKEKKFGPVVVFVPEAWKKRSDGASLPLGSLRV
jgi:hypothetical protein